MWGYLTDTVFEIKNRVFCSPNEPALFSLDWMVLWNSLLPLAQITIWIIWILFYFLQTGQHGGRVVSTVARENEGSNPLKARDFICEEFAYSAISV